MNSHIQMPRFILQNFQDENNFLAYYNVKKQVIGNRLTAKSINTEKDYYSSDAEQLLNDMVESKLSNYLKTIDVESIPPIVSISSEDEEIAKTYLYSLFSRDPQVRQITLDETVFLQFASDQEINSIVAIDGIEAARQIKLLDDYRFTFWINRTSMPFILPVCGSYAISINGVNHLILPVSPALAFDFFDSKKDDTILLNETDRRVIVSDSELQVYWMNHFAFITQCKTEWGYIVSNDQALLQALKRSMTRSSIEMNTDYYTWLGNVPEGWTIKKLKQCFIIVAGSTPKTEISEYWDGNIPWITPADYKTEDVYVSTGRKNITEEGLTSCATMIVPPGSIVFSKRAPVGSIAISRNILCTNQGCLSCVPFESIDSKYFYYVLSILTEYFETLSTGTTFKELSADAFSNFKVGVPPYNQQRMISRYLDVKCAEIDAVIAAKEKTNALLKERRQSIIYEAVTKGLDPDVKMKDSGVEWIGEIPEEWDCVKISRVIQNNKDGIRVGPFGSALTNAVVSSQYGTVKIYGQANLIRKDFTFGDNYVSQETYEKLSEYEVLPNDIAVSMMGTIGKCCVVPSDIVKGIMDSHLIKIRLKDSYYPRFFEYIYESVAVYEQLVAVAKGSIMSGLNSSIVKNVYVTLPSIEDQSAIVNYLDSECSKIDATINATESTIEKLKEYRQSVIYEAVTGKVEV